jgi:hypothetical protein
LIENLGSSDIQIGLHLPERSGGTFSEFRTIGFHDDEFALAGQFSHKTLGSLTDITYTFRSPKFRFTLDLHPKENVSNRVQLTLETERGIETCHYSQVFFSMDLRRDEIFRKVIEIDGFPLDPLLR